MTVKFDYEWVYTFLAKIPLRYIKDICEKRNIENNQLIEDLLEYIDTVIDPENSKIIYLYFRDNYTELDIANMLKIDTATVNSIIRNLIRDATYFLRKAILKSKDSILELNLPSRTCHALMRNDILTISSLLKLDYDNLLMCRDIGLKSYNKIIRALEAKGYNCEHMTKEYWMEN